MSNPFGSDVVTVLDNAARVTSTLAKVVDGRGVDPNTLVPNRPNLANMINAAKGMVSNGSKVENLSIGSLDAVNLTVVADYNPKELQIDKQIPWHQHNSLPIAKRTRDGEQTDAEINSVPARSMTIELLFDGFEDNRSVQPQLDTLEAMSSIRNPDSKDESLRRPHYCLITCGAAGIRPFSCVIESLSTKLTMFAPS